MSLQKFSGSGGGFDPYRMRREMPDLWAGYLGAHYGSPVRVVEAFGVTFQTACNWLEGAGRPTSDKVACDIVQFPGRFEAHLARHLGRAA